MTLETAKDGKWLSRRDFVGKLWFSSLWLVWWSNSSFSGYLAETFNKGENTQDSYPMMWSPRAIVWEDSQFFTDRIAQIWLDHPLVANFFAKDKNGYSNGPKLLESYRDSHLMSICNTYGWELQLIAWSDKNFSLWWTIAESGLNSQARSYAWAKWLRQFMPKTRSWLYDQHHKKLQSKYPWFKDNPFDPMSNLILSQKYQQILHNLSRDYDGSLMLIGYHGWPWARKELIQKYYNATGEELHSIAQIYRQWVPDELIRHFMTKGDNHIIYPWQVMAWQYISDQLMQHDSDKMSLYCGEFMSCQQTTSKWAALDDIRYDNTRWDYSCETNQNISPAQEWQRLQLLDELMKIVEQYANQQIRYVDDNLYGDGTVVYGGKKLKLSLLSLAQWWVKIIKPQNLFEASKLRLVLEFIRWYGLGLIASERLASGQEVYHISIRPTINQEDLTLFSGMKLRNFSK